jgi:nucleoside-diphosphate-sugar epimerase
MRVFVTGGTGHSGSYVVPELIAAGHEVIGLARSDTSAAALSALGAKVRRGDLEDLEGLKEAAAHSDGVVHIAHRQDLLPSGGIAAAAAVEVPIMLAYGVIGLAEQGVRSSIVRIANILPSTTAQTGFLLQQIALANQNGSVGYPGDGTNQWTAVHARDVASLFRSALEEGPAGSYWHAVDDSAIPFRTIADALASRLDLPATTSPPTDDNTALLKGMRPS